NIALLHCVTAYPAPAEEYNLRVLRHLAALFGIAVGVSDHSLDPLLVPAVSAAMGAAIIEKHICLSKNDDGLDDPVALEPQSFAAMVSAVRSASAVLVQNGTDESLTEARILAYLASAYGKDNVAAVLGDGQKRLAPSEAANYERTNRSIHAKRPISRGERLCPENLAVLRTEKVLRPGLPPRLLDMVYGRFAARDVPDGEGLEWADIGGY
ncbi:MAG: N-acetylneuraminate synthase family protein, partial [Spirochaetales bacterium]|nr:N-acetylneuraminate synthase family protein [Spirochaetales bacterium]